MAYLYPNGDTQQLNLSWFLAKFKELYEYVMNLDPGEASMDTILSRFTDQYNPTTTYVAGDYCIFDGYIYKANQATSGMFNSGAWDPALPVNDIQDLREAAVTDVQYTPGDATANGLLRKTVNGSTSTVMTVDKEPTQNSQNPVKSGSVYEELTELKGSLTSLEDDVSDLENAKAPINSPTFTGTPKSVTPTSGDDSTNIATTEFVNDAIGDAIEIDALTINNTVPSSVGTGSNLVITKSGNFLRLSGAINLNSSIAGKDVVIATVPELYRTQANPSFLAWATYNNTTGWYYFEYSNSGNIKPNIGSGTLTGTIIFPSCIIPNV